MRNIRKILYMMAAAVGCGLLPLGCVKEDVAPLGEQHNVAVQLNVGTRAVDDPDGTPTDVESAIHTLRVYAFVGGKPAGHYFTNNVTEAPHTFFMDITFYSNGVQTVDFYAVANEAAMISANYSLSENTSETQLKNLWFTDYQDNIQQYGLPMFCDKQSFQLDFTKVKQESPTDPDHADHSWIEHDNISFELKRPFGKLGVFAAKAADETAGETTPLRITGLTMLESGTRFRNYLMTPTAEQLAGISNASGDIELSVVEGEVTKELAAGATLAERQNTENYTPVLATPFYPFENPYANGGSWNISGDDGKEHVLKIDYAFGDEPRTGYVYMPAVERNTYYAICCLMHNDGKITVEYTVADWDDGGEYVIEFNYPQYTNPIQPEDGSTLTGSDTYSQPEVYYSTTDEGSYTFKFQITGPDNQKWTPTLVDGTQANFRVRVYQFSTDGNATKTYLYSNDPNDSKAQETPDDPEPLVRPETDNDKMVDRLVASNEPYYITVSAMNADNVDKESSEVGLAIAYDRSWSTDGSALLLINGLTGNLKWAGSDVAEVIKIKQIEAPEGEDNESRIND